MLFNSLEFLIFFPVVTALYFAVPLRARWALLLVASSVFYMAFIPEYVLIIYATIAVDYVAGLMIARSRGSSRKVWLIASLVANVGALCVFKYFNFFIDNANAASAALGISASFARWDIILPIGLSFHTFQAMSYTIEVYRGNVAPERNFAVYALYVLFYPQLVAGPIERPQNILHQLKIEHRWNEKLAKWGLRLMLWGFFKKVVVADRLAHIVDVVYSNPDAWAGPILILATVAFAFQIYADFSGYSDIAIGAAAVMGISLMTNFRQPYVSRSVSEFWSRWHISLSTWFRDYVYIPLGGNRCSQPRNAFNLMVTFLLSGLWHGANWTYVIWGGLNGLFLVVERTFGLDKGKSIVRVAVTFALICVTWVFFRAATVSDAVGILTGFGRDAAIVLEPSRVLAAFTSADLEWYKLLAAAAGLFVLVVVDRLLNAKSVSFPDFIGALPTGPRWALYWAAAVAMCVLGSFGEQQFIYFQF